MGGAQSGMNLDGRIEGKSVRAENAVDQQGEGVFQSEARIHQGLNVELVKLFG